MRTALNGSAAAALAGVLALAMLTSSDALAFAPNAAVKTAAPTDVINVEATRKTHHRRNWYPDGPAAYRAGPGPAPGCPGLYSWNPANPDRGFCDPGFAYHGNINGCVIDQGYGRWASCNGMR
jgi:hypothetical protein